MNMVYIYGLMALLGGIGLSVQAAINSNLSFGIGAQPLVAALISFFVGTVCLGIIAYFQADWNSVQSNLTQQSIWKYIGGMIGAAFVFTSIFLAPKIGITNTMFLFILGQLFSGMLIDHFGLINMLVRAVHWWKLLGMGIMLSGLVIFMFGERFFSSNS